MTLIAAYAALAGVLLLAGSRLAATRRLRARQFRLLAYILELRDVSASTALLIDRFDEAVASSPHLRREELARWRDDGAKYCAILSLALAREFENQVLEVQHRLGHSPLTSSDHKALDYLFEVQFGHSNEGRWSLRKGDPLLILLRSLLNRSAIPPLGPEAP